MDIKYPNLDLIAKELNEKPDKKSIENLQNQVANLILDFKVLESRVSKLEK